MHKNCHFLRIDSQRYLISNGSNSSQKNEHLHTNKLALIMFRHIRHLRLRFDFGQIFDPIRATKPNTVPSRAKSWYVNFENKLQNHLRFFFLILNDEKPPPFATSFNISSLFCTACSTHPVVVLKRFATSSTLIPWSTNFMISAFSLFVNSFLLSVKTQKSTTM